MRIDVFFTPQELGHRPLRGRVVAVIDVLRATSTVVQALANGARTVYPVPSIDEAVRLAQTLGRREVLLCGERDARRIEGFDLGNSPAEFSADAVRDKVVIMSTTNGTPALLTGGNGDRCLVASFLNQAAVTRALRQTQAPIVMLCAGREGRFSLDDALCAGALVNALRAQGGPKLRLNDAAQAAAVLERRYRTRLAAVIAHTAAARQIIAAGYPDDIAYCLTTDRHTIVPVLANRQITVATS